MPLDAARRQGPKTDEVRELRSTVNADDPVTIARVVCHGRGGPER